MILYMRLPEGDDPLPECFSFQNAANPGGQRFGVTRRHQNGSPLPYDFGQRPGGRADDGLAAYQSFRHYTGEGFSEGRVNIDIGTTKQLGDIVHFSEKLNAVLQLIPVDLVAQMLTIAIDIFGASLLAPAAYKQTEQERIIFPQPLNRLDENILPLHGSDSPYRDQHG
jgi:hypothetical protein